LFQGGLRAYSAKIWRHLSGIIRNTDVHSLDDLAEAKQFDMPPSGKHKRLPTEVFCLQESGKPVVPFYEKSYTITKIITQTQEKVPNPKGFTKAGEEGVLL